MRPLPLVLALALSGCVATVSTDGSASVVASGVPQPAAAMIGHAQREHHALDLLEQGLTACDAALSNKHLLPSEFTKLESKYRGSVEEAVLQDATLRSSDQVWSAPSGQSSTYDSWLTRCDAWFGANHEVYAAAEPAEAAAQRGHAPAHDGLLRSCKIEGGHLTDCGEPFTGETPLLRDGVYRSCSVNGGQVDHCGAPAEGNAVVEQGGTFRQCDLAAGQPAACSDLGYDGAAPAMK
jgi:hypothetical protein